MSAERYEICLYFVCFQDSREERRTPRRGERPSRKTDAEKCKVVSIKSLDEGDVGIRARVRDRDEEGDRKSFLPSWIVGGQNVD